MNRYLVEFIGTFFLVLTIGLVAPEAGALAPFAIAAILCAMIYAGGPVSMAHYNPAVSLAFWLRGRLESKDIGPYLIAQFAAALLAGLIVIFLEGEAAQAKGFEHLDKLIIAEILFTFALVFTILHVAISRRAEGNNYFGVAIALVVLAGALAVGTISGAAFNPAVTLGACLMGLLAWTDIWAYFVAQAGGAVLAYYAFAFIEDND